MPPGGAGEDASVNVQTASDIAVGAVEGEMLLATTIIGLVSKYLENRNKMTIKHTEYL